MKEGDILITGNALNNESEEKILQPYGSKEIKDFFIEIPKQLGIKEDQLELNISFKNSRIEISFTLKDDVEVKNKDRKIELWKRK